MSTKAFIEETAADQIPAAFAERLESWKEIAVYFRRSVRCVQRWERSESLPVHRHVHAVCGTVYAFRSELEVWSRARANDERRSGKQAVSRKSVILVSSKGLPMRFVLPAQTSWTW